MLEHGLGRLPSPPDGRDYKMAAALKALDKIAAPRPVKTWHSDKVLNQGQTPHCVGFSWAGWGIATPIEAACKTLDGEPGAQNGSTVRSGAKVMATRNKIKTYFFANTIDEAADYVARYGPVVLGTAWYQGMYKPSLFNNIIRPTGKLLGGHAYLWIGVDKTYATIRNSWGIDWGKSGDARIPLNDLKKIFSRDGEACAATERALNIGGM
jgi:hypothetical protein